MMQMGFGRYVDFVDYTNLQIFVCYGNVQLFVDYRNVQIFAENKMCKYLQRIRSALL